MADSKWLNYCTETNAGVSFFCFPHAGSGASVYAGWGEAVSRYFSYYPVQYPMRENRKADKMPGSIRELAEVIAEENLEIFSEKPCVFFGQCLGALIAFETALALKRRSVETPTLIIAAGCPSPGTSFSAELGENDDNSAVAEYFVRLGYISREIAENKMYLDFFMPVLRADYLLMQTYKAVPGEKVSCPVMTVYGNEDTEVNDETLTDWENYTSAGTIKKMYTGGHFCMTDENLADLLSEADNFIS